MPKIWCDTTYEKQTPICGSNESCCGENHAYWMHTIKDVNPDFYVSYTVKYGTGYQYVCDFQSGCKDAAPKSTSGGYDLFVWYNWLILLACVCICCRIAGRKKKPKLPEFAPTQSR